LKPGGRVAVSDLLARKPLPYDMTRSVAAYVGCIAGTPLVHKYEDWLKGAGFDGTYLRHGYPPWARLFKPGPNHRPCSG